MNPPIPMITWIARDREEELRAEVHRESRQANLAPERQRKPRPNSRNRLIWAWLPFGR